MSKFIKIVLRFLLPILIIGFIMEVMLRQKPNAFKVKSNYLETNYNSIETLILGSSHTLYGVNPEYLITDAINFANVSQTIDIDYKLLENFTPQLPNLKYVIIRLSYATLYEQLENSNESWRIKDYNLYTSKRLDASIKHHSELLSVKLSININRILEYYIFDSFNLNTTKKGWEMVPKPKETINLDESGRYSAKMHTIEDKSFFVENVAYLNNIMAYCQKRHIQVLLVTTPTYKSYSLNLDEKQLESTIAIGRKMQTKYNNCSYYNLLKSSKFETADFFDGDHLNIKGAEKLTKLLNDEIRELRYIQN